MGKVDLPPSKSPHWPTEDKMIDKDSTSLFEQSAANCPTDIECWPLPQAAQMMILMSGLLWIGIIYFITSIF